MTDRIDHAAEALRVIMTLPSGNTLDQAYAYTQVHATLALVEQQKIANDLLREVVNHVTGANN